MKKKISSLLILCIITSIHTEDTFSLHVRALTPQTTTRNELDHHREIAANAFLTYNSALFSKEPQGHKVWDAFFVPTRQGYYDYCEWFYTKFMNRTDDEFFIFGAYDTDGTLVGGMHGKTLTGPCSALGLQAGQKAYYINLLYVDPNFQNKGIGKALIKALTTVAENKPVPTPIFLYTYTINTSARKVYESCGFTVITDTEHPNGEWTEAAQLLLFDDEIRRKDSIAYRKN